MAPPSGDRLPCTQSQAQDHFVLIEASTEQKQQDEVSQTSTSLAKGLEYERLGFLLRLCDSSKLDPEPS